MNFDKLYSRVRDLPIIDWHNHLDMKMLAEDRPLGSLYEVWVKSDPYKHRAMRICGEPERVITGDADEDEKWAAWKRTLPKLVGNPLFAWAKMEMEWLGIFNAEAQRRRDEELSYCWHDFPGIFANCRRIGRHVAPSQSFTSFALYDFFYFSFLAIPAKDHRNTKSLCALCASRHSLRSAWLATKREPRLRGGYAPLR